MLSIKLLTTKCVSFFRKKLAPLEAGRAFRPLVHTGGFIALVSVIILGFVLMVIVSTLGSRSIGTRFLLFDVERKDISKGLAQGCTQVAIIAVVNNPAFSVSNTNWRIVPVDSLTCAIRSVMPNSPSVGRSTIHTTASSTGAVTNLEVVWDVANEIVSSYREVPNF